MKTSKLLFASAFAIAAFVCMSFTVSPAKTTAKVSAKAKATTSYFLCVIIQPMYYDPNTGNPYGYAQWEVHDDSCGGSFETAPSLTVNYQFGSNTDSTVMTNQMFGFSNQAGDLSTFDLLPGTGYTYTWSSSCQCE